MCIAKENFKISIQDIIDFISNVLEKITSIPGVGEVMSIVDSAMESVMGFVAVSYTHLTLPTKRIV